MKKHRKNKPAPPPGLPPEEKPPVKEQPKKQPFLKRLLFGEETPDLSELEAGSTTILDILSPTSVDTKSRDYIVVDGIFHAYLYITGYGYSTTVGASWLAPLVEAGEGVSIFNSGKPPFLFIFIIIWLSVAPIRIATEDIMNPDTVVAQEIMAFNRNSKRGITKSGIFIKYSPKPVRNPTIIGNAAIRIFRPMVASHKT